MSWNIAHLIESSGKETACTEGEGFLRSDGIWENDEDRCRHSRRQQILKTDKAHTRIHVLVSNLQH